MAHRCIDYPRRRLNRALETERHRLRPIRRSERAELHALFTDPQVRRWLFDDRVIDDDDVDQLIVDSDALETKGLGHWTLREKSDDRLIGTVGLQPFEDHHVELVYLLSPSDWGRGHATEACEALLRHAFIALELPRVIAQADAPNAASIEVMKRIGMAFDCTPETGDVPLVQYAIEREQFIRRLQQ